MKNRTIVIATNMFLITMIPLVITSPIEDGFIIQDDHKFGIIPATYIIKRIINIVNVPIKKVINISIYFLFKINSL